MTKTGVDVGNELDLASKLRNPAAWRAVLELRERGKTRAPVALDLDPTSFCDLSCPSCISKGVLNRARFRVDRLVQLGAEIVDAGVKAVVLIGGGEPLMHPATGTLAGVLARAGVQVGLVTNGTLLQRNVEWVASTVRWTRVSVDAATSETFDRLRPGRHGTGTFARVLEGMRVLNRVKQGTVGFSFMVSALPGRCNVDEVAPAAALARSLGCDYVEYKAELGIDHNILPVAEEYLAILKTQFARAIELRQSGFNILIASNMQALLNRRLDQEKHYSSCAVAQLRTTVTPEGVFVCAYHRGKSRFRIGDVLDQRFREMWSAADTSVVDPVRDCRFFCTRDSTNLAVHFNDYPDGPGPNDEDLFI